jgi:hypothetical protein
MSSMSPSKPATQIEPTSGRFKKMLAIFREAMKLETDIFQFPIELRTLIPDYYRKLNPDYVTDFQARIQKLAKKLDEVIFGFEI